MSLLDSPHLLRLSFIILHFYERSVANWRSCDAPRCTWLLR